MRASTVRLKGITDDFPKVNSPERSLIANKSAERRREADESAALLGPKCESVVYEEKILSAQ